MTSGRRGGGWVLAIGLAGAACTVLNPAYGPDADDDAEGEGSQSGSAEAGGTATTDRPGEGTQEGGGGTQEGGDTQEGGEGTQESGGGSGLCETDEHCSDGDFCNGIELCGPDKPEADAEGCIASEVSACEDGLICDEDDDACLTDCERNPDFDQDGVPAVNCGGADCDDAAPGITVPNDWAHCGECGVSCDALEACMGGGCVPARRVFVSSWTFEGNVGGLAAADGACQDLADAAQLEGTFKAFIVDGTGGLGRLEPAPIPYVRLDGVPVANGFGQLAAPGGLFAPIDRDEQRNHPDDGILYAWTGIFNGKAMSDLHCSNWSTTKGLGLVGLITSVAVAWKAANVEQACNVEARIYCIEQDPSFVPGG